MEQFSPQPFDLACPYTENDENEGWVDAEDIAYGSERKERQPFLSQASKLMESTFTSLASSNIFATSPTLPPSSPPSSEADKVILCYRRCKSAFFVFDLLFLNPTPHRRLSEHPMYETIVSSLNTAFGPYYQYNHTVSTDTHYFYDRFFKRILEELLSSEENRNSITFTEFVFLFISSSTQV